MFDQTTLTLAVAILFFAVGLIFSFLPIVPGSIIAWLGLFIHKLWLQEASVSWPFFWFATGLVLLAQVIDLLLTYWGARTFGATWRGGLGGVLGGIIGVLILNLPGLVMGPIIGTMLGELIGGRGLREAGRAGLGAFIGGLVTFFFKLLATLTVITGFIIAMIY